MKRYHFRLDSVLRVRRVQEEIARGAAAQATARTQEAAARHRAAEANVARLDAAPSPAVPAAWTARRGVVLAAAAEAAGTCAGLDAARADRAGRIADLASARMRVRALERLDTRRHDEHSLDVDRHNAAVLDDLVTSRWRLQDREAGIGRRS